MGMASLAMPFPLLGGRRRRTLDAAGTTSPWPPRQYWTRMYELRPEVAARMGQRPDGRVARYRPAAAERAAVAFLAAVTAERRAGR